MAGDRTGLAAAVLPSVVGRLPLGASGPRETRPAAGPPCRLHIPERLDGPDELQRESRRRSTAAANVQLRARPGMRLQDVIHPASRGVRGEAVARRLGRGCAPPEPSSRMTALGNIACLRTTIRYAWRLGDSDLDRYQPPGSLPPVPDNYLYYGDNLDVLRRHVDDESVDLVYLDPPFKSDQDYNVLFADRSGEAAAAQIQAFEDTWHWDLAAAEAYREMVEEGGPVSRAMQAFRTLLGENDMLAYLSMMAPRLVELRRVLKPTGSLYLHCDPTASHYLKMLLDAVFGPRNFRAEIVWKRTSAHSNVKQGRKAYGQIHDILLFYTRSDEWTWNQVYVPFDQSYIESHYRKVEEETGRRYRTGDLTAARPGGDTEYEWRIKRRVDGGSWEADLEGEYEDPKPGWEYKGKPPYKGRYWAYSRDNMAEFEREGRIHYTRTGMLEYKRYLDEMPGMAVSDLWTDIAPINSQAAERLGYPTQKPEGLLERVIKTSSNEGDVVLDPFCGCGTTIAVAEQLERRWIGIDITHLAVSLMKHRLQDAFGDEIEAEYEVIGEPVSVPDAEKLAANDPYQFQWWALGLVGARPVEEKKGADKGIDGHLYFHDDESGTTKQIIFSVKAGKTGPAHVRDLRGVVEREEAEIGVLLTMQEPTQKMREEAAAAGFYTSPWGNHPKLQVLPVSELLDGKRVDRPPTRADATFKKAPRAVAEDEQGELYGEGDD